MFQLFHEIAALPEIKTLFTIESPMDWIGVIFFFSILYVLVVGTATMLFNQVKHVAQVVARRRETRLDVQSYTRSVLSGTAPELVALQRSDDPVKRRAYVEELCRKLARDPSPVARSLVKQLRRHQRRGLGDVKWKRSGLKNVTPVKMPKRGFAVNVEGHS